MFTLIALLISIVLQFIAAFMAISLTKETRYNASWILISIGLLFMALRRTIEFIPFLYNNIEDELKLIDNWLGITTSILITIGIIFIKKIFNFLKRAEITRKNAEKKILKAIIETEERERKRFATDLHDGLGPLLSTVKMYVSALTQSTQPEKKDEIIAATGKAINEAISSIKEISNHLSPHVLDNFGLSSAVKSFTNKITQAGKIQIDFDTNIDNKRFRNDMEVILYRVICELISNTIKHANASKIEISLLLKAGYLEIHYSDNGVGFEVEEVLKSESPGMGYSNIQSRINSINGTFYITSDKDQGIHALIRVKI